MSNEVGQGSKPYFRSSAKAVHEVVARERPLGSDCGHLMLAAALTLTGPFRPLMSMSTHKAGPMD
jgi:hypothetical protein